MKVEQNQNGVGVAYGSGSLLAGTNWVLTAGHVVCYENSNIPYQPSEYMVWFDTPNGRIGEAVTKIVVNPTFDGNPSDGGDIALVQLANVPEGVTGYELYTGTDEMNKVYTIVGYGTIGLMSQGAGDNFKDIKHTGENVFEIDRHASRGVRRPLRLARSVALRCRRRHAGPGRVREPCSTCPIWGWASTRRAPPRAIPAVRPLSTARSRPPVDFGHVEPGRHQCAENRLDLRRDRRLRPRLVASSRGSTATIANSTTEYLVNSNDLGLDPNTGNAVDDRQPIEQPGPFLGGDGRRRRLHHRLDQLRPRRRQRTVRRQLRRRKRHLRQAILRQRLGEEQHLPGQSNHRRATSRMPTWRWTPTATSSSPGKATRTARTTTSMPAATSRPPRPNTSRTSPNPNLPLLHAVRHEPVVRPQRRKRRRIPGQLDDRRRSALSQRRHGRHRRLHRRLERPGTVDQPGRVLSTLRQADRRRSSHRHRRGLHRRQHRQASTSFATATPSAAPSP